MGDEYNERVRDEGFTCNRTDRTDHGDRCSHVPIIIITTIVLSIAAGGARTRRIQYLERVALTVAAHLADPVTHQKGIQTTGFEPGKRNRGAKVGET